MSEHEILASWVSSATAIETPVRIEVTVEGRWVDVAIFAHAIPRPARFRLGFDEAAKLATAVNLAAVVAECSGREGGG